uniref:Oxysterol-binding protein n=1 Tax=Geotrypetes seraphini TaxID=260995 RepID=A0A6P8RPN6_GEOSA|nr:oxysterol-binding protein-related protein 8 isoform X2 [Geotrypetes seraphini]
MEAVLEGEPEKTLNHVEIKDSLSISSLIGSNDDLPPVTTGKMNQRQGKEAYLMPTKDLVQATLNANIIQNYGFDRGKDDVLQSKEDSAQLMSKSKSESKLYNGSEKDISSNKLTKKETLKVQKKNYREEKKRATKELLSTITDPSVIVMADWLKIRGTLKSWTKLWCVLKPGVLLIYKSPKNDQWVGTVLLNACEIIERPSKKDGFCFKIFHPLEQSIWAVKGPKGEAVGSITQPLPSSYLIIRATSESDGRCWMDALELALKCSSLLKRTMIREGKEQDQSGSAENTQVTLYGLLRTNNLHNADSFLLNDSEIERQHFKDQDMYSDKSDRENDQDHDESDNEVLGESDSDTSERQDDSYIDPESSDLIKETTYTEEIQEELGEAGEASQTETVSEEHKSLIWTLLKQVRPGMDLSKVVLPTFILEPRSFLDRLSDYYYHADFLSEAAVEENAYNRMKKVVKWYLSGFYKKPKGLKKPYNPILGETFRCMWLHPTTNSKTFYIAEQISHHPPISAFYVSNRKDGFCLSGSILAKSKFYGILYGTMTLELGGSVTVECEKTGYSAIIEFKLKPFLGGDDSVNQITGKIKLGKEVLSTLEGHWDSAITINDKNKEVSELFWNPTPDVRQSRLKRCTVQYEDQGEFESARLWQNVTRAIINKDQEEATQEKFILEETQRAAAKDRKARGEEWTSKLFERNPLTDDWDYKYADTRPWDPLNDLIQFEYNGIIQTKVRHRTPMVYVPNLKHIPSTQPKLVESIFSSPELDNQDSSGSEVHLTTHGTRIRKKATDLSELLNAIESIKKTQEEINSNIIALQNRMMSNTESHFLHQRDYIVLFFLILLLMIVNYLLR